MSVRIQLDNPHAFYTNLDFISGRVLLSLTSDENVASIMVKLEGESRTVLMRPTNPTQNRRERHQGALAQENHKILYKVSQVFPSNSPGSTTAYTLGAGQHEYPFRFKLPFNNSCSSPQSHQMGQGSGLAGLALGGGLSLGGLQQMQYRHVKRTLPPSLTGFPGEAEIRYYIKVTVNRPSLFKENRRSSMGFKFMPIEPPRAPPTTNEVYARRPFAFQAGLASVPRKSSLFKKAPPQLSHTAPKGEVDARLPSPAVLTCNEKIPLRLLFRKLNESPEFVYLTSLQVHLIGSTEVRAQDVMRVETSTWVLMSFNALSIPIGKPADSLRTETLVDSQLWDQIPLPNTIAPSFHTCNLTRKYEMEVRVGLSYGTPGNIQPQSVVLPLKFAIEIFSGIKPPAALLDAMASQPTPIPPVRPSQPATAAAVPPTYDPAYPPQLGAAGTDGMADAPPSYEDAMADDIAPVDGPRRDYSGVTDENAPGMDEKGSARPGDVRGGPPPPAFAGDQAGGRTNGGRNAVV